MDIINVAGLCFIFIISIALYKCKQKPKSRIKEGSLAWPDEKL
jgi:hypothetical protein